MVSDSDIARAARRLRDAERLVVLTGAGVSKESGVPTFRDALEGYWAQFDPQDLATPDAFLRNPKLVWDWYESRRNLLASVRPNPGHYALADLEDLFPQVVIVTQNVDGLHRAAGSSDVIELHGDITQHRCYGNCQGNPTLIDIHELDWNREKGPPPCPHCGAFVRPNVVWFNEMLPPGALERAVELAKAADAVIVVGTSGMVQPAASLPYYARWHGDAYLIDVNPERDEIAPICDLFLQGPSGEVLPRLVQALRGSP